MRSHPSKRCWSGPSSFLKSSLCPLERTGGVRHLADSRPGAAVASAARRKREVTYPEFEANRRCRLIVCGLETGGRWGDEAIALLRGLAQAKAREVPPSLRGTTPAAYTCRWASLVAIAAQRALAASLLELPGGGNDHTDDGNPQLHSVLADARHEEDFEPSRLPLRAGR